MLRNALHLLTLLAALPFAVSAANTNQYFATAREMAQFASGQPQDACEFAVTGTVTWCRDRNLLVKDASGSCHFFSFTNTQLKVGAEVAVTGWAHLTAARDLWYDRIGFEELGRKPAPEPRTCSLAECMTPDPTFELIRTQATVIDIYKDELDPRFDWLVLKDGSGIAVATCPHRPDNERLIDARVEITGPIFKHTSGARKFTNPFISAELGNSLKVLAPLSGDPFDAPLLRPAFNTNPAEIERMGLHAAIGKVIATWPPNHCLMKSPDGAYVQVELAADNDLPAQNSLIRAVGYPSSDQFNIWLVRAKTRPEEMADIPDAPAEEVSAEHLFPNISTGMSAYGFRLANQRVTVRGRLKGVETHNDGTQKAFLDCGKATVTLEISSQPNAFEDIDVGSEVSATGICILTTERWNPNNVTPRIVGLQIVLSENPVVLHGPSWWSTRNLMFVIALLLVALVGVHLQNLINRRIAKAKLNERTQLAVEIHDSLSQALTGLAFQVNAAQDAVETDLPTTISKLAVANQMLLSCRAELRSCLFDLRNDTLSEKNFRKAILKTLEPLDGNAEVTVRFNVDRTRFADPTAHAILAIIRELVANSIRHGKAWSIRVAGLIDHGNLLFSVTDDGLGFDIEHRLNSRDGHFGLDGIHGRLARLKGTLSFKKPPSGGMRAIVTIPLRNNSL